jgi:V/A-type H+-transporting ATPase subunit G/H
MTTISEAITTIKKAENDADKLIESTKENSSEKIEESRIK